MITNEQILASHVASCFKAALIEARHGWPMTGTPRVRVGYEHAGAVLARRILSDIDELGVWIDSILIGHVPEEPTESDVPGLLMSPPDRALAWLQVHRSHYLELVQPRHLGGFIGGFIRELERDLE